MERGVLPVTRLGHTAFLLAGLCCLTTPARSQDREGEAEAAAPAHTQPTAGMIFNFIPRVYTMAPTEGVGHRVLVVYAIPATRLTRADAEEDAPYLAHLRLSVVDVSGDSILVTDVMYADFFH